MAQFLKNNSLSYHVDGGYINTTIDRYDVKISSSYKDENMRNIMQLTLSQQELDQLISHLIEIRLSNTKNS